MLGYFCVSKIHKTVPDGRCKRYCSITAFPVRGLLDRLYMVCQRAETGVDGCRVETGWGGPVGSEYENAPWLYSRH